MSSRDYSALDHLIMGFEKVKGAASGDGLSDWIPACAGMTEGEAGITKGGAGMTKEDTGMTDDGTRTTVEEAGMMADADRLRSAALMRVNHAGEVAAQALYAGHAVAAGDARVRDAMLQAAAEEGEHLDWCEARVRELDSHVSYLTPLWYFGSFAIGAAAGAAGDKWSLGFVMETERQVVEHLTGTWNGCRNRTAGAAPYCDRCAVMRCGMGPSPGTRAAPSCRRRCGR